MLKVRPTVGTFATILKMTILIILRGSGRNKSAMILRMSIWMCFLGWVESVLCFALLVNHVYVHTFLVGEVEPACPPLCCRFEGMHFDAFSEAGGIRAPLCFHFEDEDLNAFSKGGVEPVRRH